MVSLRDQEPLIKVKNYRIILSSIIIIREEVKVSI